jgi:heat shock protein HslJ
MQHSESAARAATTRRGFRTRPDPAYADIAAPAGRRPVRVCVENDPMRNDFLTAALTIAVTVLLTLTACQPDGPADAPAAGAGAETAAPLPAPAADEVANTTYLGVDGGPVTLTDGEWQGEPYVEGGASAPRAGLVRDFRLTGDLDGDGAKEAVVLLWTSGGGSGTFDYVAVVGRNRDGAPVNLGTAALGDRVAVRDMRVEGDRIVADVVQAGADDAACCPGQKVRRTFALSGDALAEIASEDQGRLAVADLAGTEWALQSFGLDGDGMPDGTEVTLMFDGERIAGNSGCNQYAGGVVEGDTPGSLALSGPLVGTAMTCPPPADAIESRYVTALQTITQYSFIAGRLVLSWRSGDDMGTLVFRRRPPVDPAGAAGSDPGAAAQSSSDTVPK